MPKLKVPTVAKPAKKQTTLQQYQWRPLHTPSPEKAGISPKSKSSPLVGRLSGSPRKHNGLKAMSKTFYEMFGESEGEVGF